SAIFNLVSDCGCFGDAIHLTNWETFYKNVVLIVLTFFVFSYRKKYKSILTIKGQSIFISIAIVFILLISVYCYRHLPLIDFLPWKTGNKISEQVVPTPEEAKIFLVYKNGTTGETKQFTAEEFTKSGVWKDSLWMINWKFVEQKKEIITPFKDAPIHDFKIMDQDGNDHTDAIINQPNFNFLLVAHSLEKTSKKAFLKINDFAKQCNSENIIFVALTATSFDKIDYFRHDVQAMYDFYNVDETALKTIIRSNPGLVLLKNGTVIAKWHYNDFPELSDVKEKYFK
ncbi:MAG: DoxX family protein, partial [Bacteroidales bacterium]|nr:DoxX family protein [Bacteroidales bacterium]